MQSLEAACEEADLIISAVKTQPSSLPTSSHQDQASTEANDEASAKSSFCIVAKLRELFIELNQPGSVLVTNSLLLEKLVARERLHTLILNLCAGNKGYSFCLRVGPRVDDYSSQENSSDQVAISEDESLTNMIETIQWPYEEEELLQYVDNEELPGFLIDLLEADHSHLFYNGCIILEVRDFRQTYPQPTCDIHFVLLKPSVQSILSDVNSIMDKNSDWGSEEKLLLESQLTLATNPTLCLDPSPTVSLVINKIHHETQVLNTQPLRKRARKFSQVTVNRKRKLDQFTHHPGLELHDFIGRLRARTRGAPFAPSSNLKVPRRPAEVVKPVPAPSLELPQLSMPEAGIDIKKFKAYQKPDTSDSFIPQLVEEYYLETETKPKMKQPRIKISIFKIRANNEYIGELYLEGDFKKNSENNGAACRFSLGTRANASRYIQQFTEIFTEIFAEEGREPMKITHVVPGQRPRSTRTGVFMTREATAVQAAQQAQIHAAQQAQLQAQLAQQLSRTAAQSVPSSSGLSNGEMNSSGVLLVQGPQPSPQSNTSVLQAQLQNSQSKLSSQHLNNPEISALVQTLMSSAEQFELNSAAEKAAKASSNSANSEIISRLNSASCALGNNVSPSPAGAGGGGGVVVASFQPGGGVVGVGGQKVLGGRKMALPTNQRRNSTSSSPAGFAGSANGSFSAHHLQQQQQFALAAAAAAAGGFISPEGYAAKGQPGRLQRPSTSSGASNSSSNNGADCNSNSLGMPVSGLSALLVGTPSADHPIPGANMSSALLERLTATASPASPGQNQYGSPSPKQQQYATPSPKMLSPLSSPQQQQQTLNVQNLNLAPFQTITNISGLQNVQVQIPGLSAPISLLNAAAGIQGHAAGLIVSLPVTTSTATCSPAGQLVSTSSAVTMANSNSAQTMVLTNALPIAQLMTSGVKGINQQALRMANQANSPAQAVQLVGLQRPRNAQVAGVKQALSARGLLQAQRMANAALKMAPSTTTSQMGAGGAPPLSGANSVVLSAQQQQQLQLTLQKQVQLQQYQQQLQHCLSQPSQKAVSPSAVVAAASKHHRRSSSADTNK